MKCNCNAHNGLLTAKGLEEAAQRKNVRYGIDTMDMFEYVDKVDSVSGLRRDEDMYALTSDINIDEQARRFNNGY